MRRVVPTLAAAALMLLCFAAPAFAAFGLKGLDVRVEGEDSSPQTQAGSHPFALVTSFEVNTKIEAGQEVPEDEIRDLRVTLPAGLVGNPTAVPRCSGADFLDIDTNLILPACPNSSAVGVAELDFGFGLPTFLDAPIYNLTPPPGAAAKIGFIAVGGLPVTVVLKVNPDPPHNVIAEVSKIPQAAFVYGSEVIVWGNPAASAHDPYRGNCLDTLDETPHVLVSKGNCPVSIGEKPFLTLPPSCRGPLKTGFEADSWQQPGLFSGAVVETHDGSLPPQPLGATGCTKLGFAPEISTQTSTAAAESASGLNFNLDVSDPGLSSPTGKAQADIEKAVVRMPVGVTVNPSAAEGLAACTKADYEREVLGTEAGGGCPEASKVGDVEVETPLLEGEVLHGSIFVAQPDDPATTTPGAENPFDSLLAIYMVIRDPQLGILVKLPGKIELDPKSGQMTTTFGEPGYEIPEFPFSHLRFHFRAGPRAPLVTPPACGSYQTQALLTPSSGAVPITTTASFQISSGPGGGPCPTATPPFHPSFEAGSINNNAGSYSPFYLRLSRQDGEAEITRFDSVLPPGVVGKIAGLGRCPDAAVAIAEAKSGREELASPSCPASSLIGRVEGGAGVGSSLTYVPGKIYLGGPFAGDPLSVIVITPAIAGPFDAGTVVIREALKLNPLTAQVEVDGAASQPIPHILKGIPLRLRELRVYVGRPNFTLNPTNCSPLAVQGTLWGSGADLPSAADNTPAALSQRYQAANCAALGFKPKLSLSLKGGTKRSDHPALKSILDYPPGPGYANVREAVVTLPPSVQIDNAHINNPCTRVQFNAQQCPANSVLGTARAVSPLLDEPLEGPVYFRANGGEHPLPDIVADLNGQFHIVLVGHVDAIPQGAISRLRTSFENVPDAPVSKFTLSLFGGKKGLLVNNRNLCTQTQHMKVALSGQNGRRFNTEPTVKTSCKTTGKAKRRQR